MIVLGIDPGAAGAGYAVWTDQGLFSVCDSIEGVPKMAFDAIVCESGFIGKMGRQAMWGLGADAGWRMCEARYLRPAEAIYTIRPDGVNGWRAALPPRPGCHLRFDGLPGDVIVARLRMRYGYDACGHCSEHQVEACGIAEAAAAILQRPKAKDRRALKPVRRSG